MFEFANIWVFFLFPIPFLVWILFPPVRRRSETLMAPFTRRVAEASGEKLRRSAWISRRNALQWVFMLSGWICLLGTLARPQIVGQPEMRLKTARSFLVAADISFSMAARDWVVDGKRYTRWEAVKDVMGELPSTTVTMCEASGRNQLSMVNLSS